MKLGITIISFLTLVACHEDQYFYTMDSGQSPPTIVNVNPSSFCGDGICDSNLEDCWNCSTDCGGCFPECLVDEDCEQENPCQIGTCENNLCVYDNVANETSKHICGISVENIYHSYVGFCWNGEFDITQVIECEDICDNLSENQCSSLCGNGILGGMEECDDGNLNNGDGCNSNCYLEPGFVCENSPSVCFLCGDEICQPYENMWGYCPQDCSP